MQEGRHLRPGAELWGAGGRGEERDEPLLDGDGGEGELLCALYSPSLDCGGTAGLPTSGVS